MAATLVLNREKQRGKRRAPALEGGSTGGKKTFLTRPTKKKQKLSTEAARRRDDERDEDAVQWKTALEQAEWFTSTFHAVCGSKRSALESDSITEDKMAQLSNERDHSVDSLKFHVKRIIGPSWKDVLSGESGKEAAREAGSPTLLVLCSSATRCVEIIRGLKAFTMKVKPVKLFAKHIKVEEQVSVLMDDVFIAAGTPNRVRKLADIGALGFGHLSMVILDMHRDAKGLTLLSVPEVKAEFWELYQTHVHPRVLNDQCKLCLY